MKRNTSRGTSRRVHEIWTHVVRLRAEGICSRHAHSTQTPKTHSRRICSRFLFNGLMCGCMSDECSAPYDEYWVGLAVLFLERICTNHTRCVKTMCSHFRGDVTDDHTQNVNCKCVWNIRISNGDLSISILGSTFVDSFLRISVIIFAHLLNSVRPIILWLARNDFRRFFSCNNFDESIVYAISDKFHVPSR